MASSDPHADLYLEPTIDVTINTKPTNVTEDKDDRREAEKEALPKLNRKESIESIESIVSADESVPRPARHTRRVYYERSRRFSPSPVRIYNRSLNTPSIPIIASSTKLLDFVNYDGIADMPARAQSSIYLATFPFTDRDLKKWSWLFVKGVEESWFSDWDMGKTRNDEEDEDEWFYEERLQGRVHTLGNRCRDPPFYGGVSDTSSVFLSRALDIDVVPEDTEDVRYFIVVKNKNRLYGCVKLLTAESRKAAGIMIFYEALTGNAIVFVGAVVGSVTKKARKFKRAADLGEAKTKTEKGVVNMIC